MQLPPISRAFAASGVPVYTSTIQDMARCFGRTEEWWRRTALEHDLSPELSAPNSRRRLIDLERSVPALYRLGLIGRAGAVALTAALLDCIDRDRGRRGY